MTGTNTTSATSSQNFLRQRLLQDIKELQLKPYPGIKLHVDDADLSTACLVISPEDEAPLHMTVYLTDDYPLSPPRIKMNSQVDHPNVFDDYICIDMLNREDKYTPAYTLKGICIQILSFFSSATIEQDYGGMVNRKEYQSRATRYGGVLRDEFGCKKCGFITAPTLNQVPGAEYAYDGKVDTPATSKKASPETVKTNQPTTSSAATATATATGTKKEKVKLVDLPPDVLLLFCDYLDEESLLLAARAWNGFGRLMRQHNIIRTRELQCFTLKRGFKDLDLGIGVHATDRPRAIKSEFDLVSRNAYEEHGVDRSIQGLRFEYWLPLPISHTHWMRVRKDVDERLNAIARAAGLQGTLDNVIYHFMNEIVVQLSAATDETERRNRSEYDLPYYMYGRESAPKSTLKHASEKAIESYFHLFHLLLCLATERPDIAKRANDMMTAFISGQRDKQHVPNLGHLLIMILISEVEVTDEMTKALIKEAVTRNVVWMLEPEPKGKGMPELSFMESSLVSEYRLRKSFEAGKTSYRLFMFLNLMRKIVRQTRTSVDEHGNSKKLTLDELRDDLFNRHGAPPNGAAASIAGEIREIQKVTSFPEFLVNMGLTPPSKSGFTGFLRSSVEESMNKGYSKWALKQEVALGLRLDKEPGVLRPAGMVPQPLYGRVSFFPGPSRGGGGDRGGRGGGRGDRGGRGGWRGRGGRGRGGY